MNPWDDLAVDVDAARLHTSDHWEPEEIAVYTALLDDALDPLPQPAVVLDLGCGLGRLAVPFADARRSVVVLAVDGSRRMLDLAAPARGVSYCHSSGLDRLPALDGAWSVLMFQHVDDATMAAYLHAVAGLLLPGSRFVFQWVDGDGSGPLVHERSWSTVEEMIAGVPEVEHVSTVAAIEPNWRWTTVRKVAP